MHFRFLFHTFVTVPPFPAPRSASISRSSFLTRSSPSLSRFDLLPPAEGVLFFLDVAFSPVVLTEPGVVGAVGEDEIGLSRTDASEDDDLDESCRRAMSSLNWSASDFQGDGVFPLPGTPGAGRLGLIALSMLRPSGFFREMDDLGDANEDVDCIGGVSGMGWSPRTEVDAGGLMRVG